MFGLFVSKVTQKQPNSKTQNHVEPCGTDQRKPLVGVDLDQGADLRRTLGS